MQEFTTAKFTNVKIEDLFTILFQRVESGVKYKINERVKDDYPDKVTRTVTDSHRLNPGRREGNKLAWTAQFYIELVPGRKDLTGAEIIENHILNDALSFTGYQIRDDVLFEIEYLDTWQELLNNTLAELRLLYPEPADLDAPRPVAKDDSESPKSKTPRKNKKIIKLQTKPAGRKIDKCNPIAFDILNDGKENAEHRAFSFWCDAHGITDAKKPEKDSFKQAMKRERQRRNR